MESTNASLQSERKDYKQSSDLNDSLKLDLETSRKEQLETQRELQSNLLESAKLEQSLKDKDRVLSTLREIAENAKRERDQSEATSRQFEISNKRLQDQLERSVKEIRKGNGIIGKLQNEKRDLKSKVRMSAKVSFDLSLSLSLIGSGE